jgi:Na+/H+-dicarboxylate symporter
MIRKPKTKNEKNALILGIAAGVLVGVFVPEVHETVKGLADKMRGGL